MTHQKRIAYMIAELDDMNGLTGAQEDALIEAIDALVGFKMALEHETPVDDDPYKSFRGISA